MEYTSIYKNGKIERFFIKATNKEYKAILQNYFTLTNIDKTRLGRIGEMSCLFSTDENGNGVWTGKQFHGYGYSGSADVYGELINTINKLFKSQLTQETQNELNKINTHDDKLTLSEKALDELEKLATAKLMEKWNS